MSDLHAGRSPEPAPLDGPTDSAELIIGDPATGAVLGVIERRRDVPLWRRLQAQWIGARAPRR